MNPVVLAAATAGSPDSCGGEAVFDMTLPEFAGVVALSIFIVWCICRVTQ